MRGQDVISKLGASVRHLRFRLGISQEELANRADLHRTYIAGVEGGTRNITLRSIEKLAAALEVSIPDLLSQSAQSSRRKTSAAETTVEILLVEDNPDDVALTLEGFRQARIANPVHVVTDGQEALDFLFATGPHQNRKSQRLPRVILLDLNLPKIDGLEVLRRIKANPATKDIPVVVLTSSRNSRDVIASRRLGAATYIVKPVDFQNFSRVAPEIHMKWALLETEA
jgi:CheY-like chemotaxis protein/DNA-binding Xre family transcriptional regulator